MPSLKKSNWFVLLNPIAWARGIFNSIQEWRIKRWHARTDNKSVWGR